MLHKMANIIGKEQVFIFAQYVNLVHKDYSYLQYSVYSNFWFKCQIKDYHKYWSILLSKIFFYIYSSKMYDFYFINRINGLATLSINSKDSPHIIQWWINSIQKKRCSDIFVP